MERPGIAYCTHATMQKRASSGNSGEAKCDHTNVEVGDVGKERDRRVVKPVEVWAGSGQK